MKIAIFGGSFDPAHRGHYEIVQRLLRYEDLEKVVVVPACQNPLKDNLPTLPDETRCEILEKIFYNTRDVEISLFELERGKITYTYETLLHLKDQYPEDEFYLVLGEDAFAFFHLWAEVELIFKLSEILVFPRPGLRVNQPGVFHYKDSERVKWLNVEIFDISSTQVRQSPISLIEAKGWLPYGSLDIWKRYLRKVKSKNEVGF